jgi:hypothetical protein
MKAMAKHRTRSSAFTLMAHTSRACVAEPCDALRAIKDFCNNIGQ